MSRAVYFLFGTVLIVVILALLWATEMHEKTVESLPDVLARDFQPLLKGENATDVNIGAIEKRVQDIQSKYTDIEEIIVRKVDRDGHIITVYPFSYDLDHPDFPPQRDYSYRAKTIMGENNKPIGVLFIKFSAQRRFLFNSAIIGSMAALILVSVVGLYTISTKEKQVQKTSTLLEEKQRELIHLERMALVGQLTANLLHDLKKPIHNIKQESETVEDKALKKRLQDEADLFLSMVRELHLESFLQKDTGKGEYLDLDEIVSRSIRLVKYAQSHVTVTTEIGPDLPFLFGKRHQLIQVFSNILLNAMEALEGEGTIHISGSQSEENGQKYIEVGISDDGPGIPYEHLSHIFEPFFSSHKKTDSTGLGLYITQSIVEGLGGSISVHSIPKHGTTFSVRLPAAEEDDAT